MPQTCVGLECRRARYLDSRPCPVKADGLTHPKLWQGLSFGQLDENFITTECSPVTAGMVFFQQLCSLASLISMSRTANKINSLHQVSQQNCSKNCGTGFWTAGETLALLPCVCRQHARRGHLCADVLGTTRVRVHVSESVCPGISNLALDC